MKTILGYRDKKKETYGTIEKKLPVLVDERYEPFLLTDRQLFTVKTKDLKEKSYALPIRKALHSLKNTIAIALIVPGIISAALYLISMVTSITSVGSSGFMPNWLMNLTFWLAVWGIMILWHETYRTIKEKSTILPSVPFSQHDLKLVKKGDLGISKRSLQDILDVLDNETADIIFSAVKKDRIDTLLLFQKLFRHPRCVTVIDRLEFKKKFEKKVPEVANKKNLPEYDISALRSILVYATEEAVLADSRAIEPEHLFIAFFKVFPALEIQLRKSTLNVQLMRFVASWMQMKRHARMSTQVLNPSVPYYRTGGIASSWIYGYTFVLGHFSSDLTLELAKKGGRYGIGHDTEMEEVISILSKVSKNNVLLVGESGTGKTSMAKGLAERINRRTVPSQLKDMRIIQLDINGLVAAAPQHGNLEKLVKESMEELQKAGNTILFIDEIQEIIGVHGEESKHSLAGILLPYVIESSFPIIGTITFADYKKHFYAKESLRQSFHNVEIKEVTPEAAIEIILTRLEELEHTYKVKISFPAIFAAVELAQRYIYNRKLPDSAVSTIESSCAQLRDSDEKTLLPKHIAATISAQTEIPVEDVTTEEATKLLDLENKMKARVIGQDEAVHLVVEALKRARTGIRDPKKPIGSFLFLGPTGVGKTHLSKIVGDEYFGESHKIIRLDMSEFKNVSSISRLLGSSTGSDHTQETTTFLDQVKRHPFSVILLDEMEKAHPQILDLFLQVIDEGRLTNAHGETVNFSNAIIIFTSNIGSKILLETLEKDKELFLEAKESVMQELRDSIRVEFLNRFDQIIVFSPHSMENLEKIAVLLLEELRNRLLEKEITLRWDDELPKAIAKRSHQPGLGARPMRRYIQDHLETAIAEELLKGAVKPGDVFEATPATLT